MSAPDALAHDDRGSGPPLVFLHGIGSSRRRWDGIVDGLVGDFRCLAVDLPGHGDSPPVGCNGVEAAGAVAALVERLELPPPVLVGHSLGGVVSLLTAALYGARSVVAVDPVPLHLPHLAATLAPYRERLLGADFDAAFTEWEQTLGLDRLPEPTQGLHPDAEVVRSYWSGVLDPEAAAATQVDFALGLASITVPTLVVLGDGPTPEDAAILATMATTTVDVFDGLGHFLHLVDPDRFTARLRQWVGGLAD